MFVKNFNYNNIFLIKYIIEILKYISINYIIKIKKVNSFYMTLFT